MRENGAAGAFGRMEPMNFTPEQQSAIDAKNRELLVSAAAGSGKTAVLVRRILHLIRDEGYSIDRMLVVTYTRAAAAELRDRLETAMRDAALNDPAMARQAELVGQSRCLSGRVRMGLPRCSASLIRVCPPPWIT